MDTINRKFKVTAQILTPLHIGAGAEKDWVLGMDYILQDGYLWHIGNIDVLDKDELSKLTNAFLNGDNKTAKQVLRPHLNEICDLNLKVPIENVPSVKSFLRNQLTGNPIIAGSSLKGAIRSILFTYLREKGETTNNAVFGNLNDGSDFMRFIRVGDIEFPHNSTELVNTKIFNLEGRQGNWSGGWKHKGGSDSETNTTFKETGFNTIYECLPVGKKSKGYLMLAGKLFENAKTQINVANNPNKSKIINNDITYLCEIINEHTKKYLQKELDFFKRYQQAEYTDYIYANEDDFSGGIVLLQGEFTDLKTNECIVKMSAGSGFHSITGDWQFDNYYSGTLDQKRNKSGAKPKSRKIAITYDGDDMFLDLMGFVKLAFDEIKE